VETFAPFRHRVFKWLWFASLASNLGTFMHGIGAAWLITDLTTSAAVVSLLAVASALPTFLLALPAGALTDVLDRRRLLIGAQIWMAAIAAILAVVAALGLVTIPSLLALTFLMGVGAALNMPVWAAIVPELVPREDLPQALVLNGTAFTAAQAIGPALGGLIVAASGVAAVFALNAVSFLGQIVVIWRWQRPPDEHRLPAEHVVGAMRAGVRYLRFAPGLQTVLVRSGAFIFGMSALFALLPTVGRTELGLGPAGYGLLFGALGIGSIAATFLVPRVRGRLSLDALVAAGSVGMAVLIAGLGVAADPAPVYVLMAIGGLGQLAVMSSFNLAAQSSLPAWVRGRGLAVYTLAFQFAIAVGSLTWGALASAAGTRTALLAAAAVVLASNLLAFRFSLAGAAESDMTPVHFPEPQVGATPDPDDGPVMVTAEWRIDPAERVAFTAAMEALRRARRRDGAIRHGVWHDLNDPARVVESYVVQSWAEHLRQRERATEADRAAWVHARAFHQGEDGVVVRWHLLLHPERTGTARSDDVEGAWHSKGHRREATERK
jgi:predicted MFS family arabinose efflux permease